MNLNIVRIFVSILFWILLKNIPMIYGIPKSTSNFTEFILDQSEYFVDKSLLIKELLEDNNTLISIIRPKLWGKTLNLDMIRKFFQIETDQEGVIVPDEKKINRKCFMGTELQSAKGKIRKLEPLKIANVTSAMEHQGIYPVIWLDLEYTRYCIYEEMEDYLKTIVSRIFDNYPYLQKYCDLQTDDVLSNLQKDQLRRYFTKNITTEDLSESIRFLSELLFKHFNRKVYVFVNDHNTPFVLQSKLPRSESNAYKKVTSLLKELFCRAFNDNPYLEKALFTDEVPLLEAHSEVFSHLNNFTVYTLLDDRFSKFYGFTAAEVDELMIRIKSFISRQKIDDLYKGYNYGSEVVYNPSSVHHHLILDGKYNPWLEIATLPQNVEKIISKEDWQDIVRDLYSGVGVNSVVDTSISYQNCKNPASVYSSLLFFGYLHPVSRVHQNRTYQLTVPNDEVRKFYAQKMRANLRKHLGIDISANTNFMGFLPIDLIDGFKRGYQNYISSLDKFPRLKPVEQESCYKNLMLMLIDILSSRYKTTFRKFSTNETVAALIPKGDENKIFNAVFIGYKSTTCVQDLKSEAKISLQLVKSLTCDFKNSNSTRVPKIIEIGIALCGHNTAVEYEISLM